MSDKFQQALALLAPLAPVPDWSIGGSLLLVERQLQEDFRDIDLVCSEAIAPALAARLQQFSTELPVAAHPQYCSRFFRRYQHDSGLVIELMAGIQVRQHDRLAQWPFEPSRCEQRHGVSWMALTDWLELYQLFNRPAKVALIRTALASAN
ncbi:hypothetical protein [Rheinheimera sp. F8]|uniref:hypothetical protein n=1 Tax=Rheinheimera sp. F8 TaxID=1763998 RepID=UPI000744A05A|nr:hypothetical protein [Rheinheimera sp. F8]ALZ77230.1 hypothetical protein ATY27_16690 [Rheinheimera sp. F8]